MSAMENTQLKPFREIANVITLDENKLLDKKNMKN